MTITRAELISFRGGADGPAGLMLALNPEHVTYISSVWDKTLRQNILRVHLANGRFVRVFESDAANVLRELGLTEFVEEGWVLDLERDLD